MTNRNVDGFTLAGFIRRVKAERDQQCSLLTGWRPDWDGICEEEWRFGFLPVQALERIEEREGLT
jgi:hypothetical protein